MLVSPQRDPVATRRIFTRALKHEHRLRTCTPRAVDELLSSTSHVVEQHDRAAAKARTETAALGTSNQRRAAFVGVSAEATTNSGLHGRPRHRLPAVFAELTLAINKASAPSTSAFCQCNGPGW